MRNICNWLHANTLRNYFENILTDRLHPNDSINNEYHDDEQLTETAKVLNRKSMSFTWISEFFQNTGWTICLLKSLEHEFETNVLREIDVDIFFNFSPILGWYKGGFELPERVVVVLFYYVLIRISMCMIEMI